MRQYNEAIKADSVSGRSGDVGMRSSSRAEPEGVERGGQEGAPKPMIGELSNILRRSAKLRLSLSSLSICISRDELSTWAMSPGEVEASHCFTLASLGEASMEKVASQRVGVDGDAQEVAVVDEPARFEAVDGDSMPVLRGEPLVTCILGTANDDFDASRVGLGRGGRGGGAGFTAVDNALSVRGRAGSCGLMGSRGPLLCELRRPCSSTPGLAGGSNPCGGRTSPTLLVEDEERLLSTLPRLPLFGTARSCRSILCGGDTDGMGGGGFGVLTRGSRAFGEEAIPVL